MEIKIYEKRPKLFEAVKFEDDHVLAEEIVQWVQRRGGYAYHFGPGQCAAGRIIDITDVKGDRVILTVGNYLAHKYAGVFTTASPIDFYSKYTLSEGLN